MLIDKMHILEKNFENFITEKDFFINSLVEKIQILEDKCPLKFEHENGAIIEEIPMLMKKLLLN